MLEVHRSERADRLVDALAGLLADDPLDPMDTEVVAVHSRGIERWLSQELSARLGTGSGRGDGVAANLDFPFPWRLVEQALAAAGDPVDPARDADPWAARRLLWALLRLVEAPPADLDLGPLRGHADDPRSRLGAVRRVANLFDRYAVHRPAMLRAWAAGDAVDAGGHPLARDHGWQFWLWRALHDLLRWPSPAERVDAAVRRIAAGDVHLDLPRRLSLFGLTALPASYVAVLQAVAMRHDVHLFLLHPSPSLWDRTVSALPDEPRLGSRDDDATGLLPQHPLLASWGRDAREVQVVLAAAGADGGAHLPVDDDPAPTLLRRLQSDVRHDRRPPGPPVGDPADRRAALDPTDRSVQVHSCHGRTRQVEVLRDAIAHLLADDHDLEPRDVVVMCPDVEDFAPLVHAVFGAAAVTDDRDGAGTLTLRVQLADRSLRQTNPLLEVVAGLLELADSRAEASRVLDLAGRAPVRRRFRLDDDDLSRFETWVAEVGVRWGLDGDHRADHDLPDVTANTWQAGLDRLLAGIAVADAELRTVGAVVPYDVEGADIDRAGRVAELVTRLRDAVAALSVPRPVEDWCHVLEDGVDRLTLTAERDAWQRHQLRRLLRDVVDDATDTNGQPCPVPLHLAEVRTLLADRLRGRPSRANHRTGHLTVCTLVPMRSVPHRVVCLLGMDDEAFPRRIVPDGDDLVAAAPRVGDRDRRTEDRQQLLDALLAATDTLVVTYTGRDERTNESRPPAVPIGELLDVVDATVRTADGGPARDRIVEEHPLQPFDPRNFVADELGTARPWSFDATDLAGARALRDSRPDPPPFLRDRLPPPDDGEVVALDDLVAFLHHPVRAFLGRRLGVHFPRDGEEPDDALAVELAPLAGHEVGQRLLASALAGHDLARWEVVERARGTLPPGRLADPAITSLRDTVDRLMATADHLGATGPARTVEVDVELPDGRTLVGAVPDVVGDAATGVSYSRLSARHQLTGFARLVALTATDPARPWTAVAVGRNPKTRAKATTAWCRFGPLGDTPDQRRSAALEALAVLVDLHDRGLREPLPLYAKTSAAYAEAVHGPKPNRFAAAKAWEGGPFPENGEAQHVLVLGPAHPYDALMAGPAPHADECGEGWPLTDRAGRADGPSRFEVLARRLWDPILACREDGTR